MKCVLVVLCLLPLGCVSPSGEAPPQDPKLAAVERADASYQQGLTLMAEGEYGKAVVAFTESLHAFPNQHRAHYRLARCHYQLGNYGIEISEYRKCLALNPQHKNALYHLGSAYTAQDEIALAQDCFRQLLTLSPGHSDARQALGMLEAVASSPERSVQQY